MFAEFGSPQATPTPKGDPHTQGDRRDATGPLNPIPSSANFNVYKHLSPLTWLERGDLFVRSHHSR